MKTPRFCVDCGAPLTCANRRVTRCAFCLHRRRAEAFAGAIRAISRRAVTAEAAKEAAY